MTETIIKKLYGRPKAGPDKRCPAKTVPGTYQDTYGTVHIYKPLYGASVDLCYELHSPKPAVLKKESAAVIFGNKSLLWDLNTNDHHVDTAGVVDTSTLWSVLSLGWEETTADKDNTEMSVADRGFPYQKMFWRYYREADYELYSNDLVVIKHPVFGGIPLSEFQFREMPDGSINPDDYETHNASGNCGGLMLWLQTSDQTWYSPDNMIKYQETVWGPCTCIFGELMPGFTVLRISEWNGLYYVLVSSEGYLRPTFGQPGAVEGLWNMYKCPIDTELYYYGLCTNAPFGNEAIAFADNGLRYSYDETRLKGAVAQVFYNVYGIEERIVKVHAGFNDFDNSDEIYNPLDQVRNDAFSDAVAEVLNEWFYSNGFGENNIEYSEMVFGGDTCETPGSPYWYYTIPNIEIRIVRELK